MPIVSAVTAVIGLGITAIGAAQQANQAKARANYLRAVARNNAMIAADNAKAIRERGEQEKADLRRYITKVKGSAKPVQAAKGFLVDDTEDSTNVQQMADLAEAGALDILRLDDKIKLREREALMQASNFQTQAGLYAFDASNQSAGGAFAGTLIAGAGSVIDSFGKTSLFDKPKPKVA
jgi:hypothetical protein